MTEREEFELVAKAAGYDYEWLEDYSLAVGPHLHGEYEHVWMPWNPKTDDGDSRRLQIDLGIETWWDRSGTTYAFWGDGAWSTTKVVDDVDSCPDKYAAVRAAVWDVALEVAKRRLTNG